MNESKIKFATELQDISHKERRRKSYKKKQNINHLANKYASNKIETQMKL